MYPSSKYMTMDVKELVYLMWKQNSCQLMREWKFEKNPPTAFYLLSLPLKHLNSSYYY